MKHKMQCWIQYIYIYIYEIIFDIEEGLLYKYATPPIMFYFCQYDNPILYTMLFYYALIVHDVLVYSMFHMIYLLLWLCDGYLYFNMVVIFDELLLVFSFFRMHWMKKNLIPKVKSVSKKWDDVTIKT